MTRSLAAPPNDPAERKLSVARVWRGVARTYRSRFWLLLVASLLVFVPLGLIGALDDLIQGPLEDVDADDVGVLRVLAAVGAAATHTAAASFGNIFYGGVVAAAVLATREGRDDSLARIARTLPYWRLMVIDLVVTVAVGIGLLLLIVPGLFLLARLVLAPAVVVDVESPTVRGGLRGSWRLARGSSLRVLAVVLPIAIAQSLIAAAIGSATGSIGEGFLDDWLGSTVGSLIAAPLFALALTICYYELRDLRAPPRRADPAPASSS